MRHSTLRLFSAAAIALLSPVLPMDAPFIQPFPALAQTDPTARLAEADRLFNLGITQYDVSQFQEALQSWQQALEIYQQPIVRNTFPLESRQREGGVLSVLGITYLELGQYRQAVDFYEQSLVIARETSIQAIEEAALLGLGNAYLRLGQYQQAIIFYEQQLLIFREIGNWQGEGIVLNDLGIAYAYLGEYRQAIKFYEKSLSLAREMNSRHGEGVALGNLGVAYTNLGQYGQAIIFYEQAQLIFEEIGDWKEKSTTLGGFGNAYLRLGQYQQAIDFYERSLSIARELGDQAGKVNALGGLGLAYANLGQYWQAIDFYERSLSIARDIHSQHGEGTALGGLGLVHFSLGQYQDAIDFYEQQLSIFRKIGYRQGEGNALNNLGLGYYTLEQFSLATEFLLDAIKVYESLRIEDLLDADKISFFDTYLRSYLSLQRSLIAQDEIEQALVYAEQGRARAFADLLASHITISSNPNAPLFGAIDPLDLADIRRAAREQNATLVKYSVANFGDIDDSVLYIWVIPPTGAIAFQQVDLSGQNLSELVSLVREALGVRGQEDATIASIPNPEAVARQQAQRQRQLHQLHQLLIDPIAQYLPSDPNQRVVFIPHQDLFLVPFPALINAEGQYLIENHAILTAPSIQVLDLTRQQAVANSRSGDRPDNLLIVGNPIMPQVWNPETNQSHQLSSLVGAEDEAIAIAEAFNTEALLWDSATKASVVQKMPNARIIHLATHGLLEYGTPEDSGVLDVPGAIALAPSGDDAGLLTSAEILQMNLTADLVVLSACDTGRGRITGDGVIGLSRAFTTAGVPSLMVSLWAVDDASTAVLMVEFYRQWQQTGDKAQALRQAMLTTLQDYPDPRLWAAFTLIGSAE